MATLNINVGLIRTDLLGSDSSHVQYQKLMDGTVGSETVAKVTANGLQVDRTKKSLTAAAPNNVSVGVASGALVATNANRTGLNIKNLSGNVVSIAFGTAALLNKGITLNPGEDWSMGEFDFTTAAVNAIASVAASTVAIQEWS